MGSSITACGRVIAVTTQPSNTAFMVNSFPIAGNAGFTADIMNVITSDVIATTAKATNFTRLVFISSSKLFKLYDWFHLLYMTQLYIAIRIRYYKAE